MKHRTAISLLGLSTTASFLAAAGTVLVLNPEDRISVCRGSSLTALGLVFFPSLFSLVNNVALGTGAGERFRHKYALTHSDMMDISNKLVSAVQAVLSSVTGAVVCLWSCTRDLLRSSHFMSEAYAWFGAAYFFYDIWSMYKVYVQMTFEREQRLKPVKNGAPSPLSAGDAPAPRAAPRPSFLAYCRHEPVILAHHLFIGGFGFLVIVYLRRDLGDCVFGFAYLMEVSTPLVCARGILSRLRLKSSNAYVVNGVAMLVTFFVCRVASLPYVCYMYSKVVQLSYLDAIRSLPTGCKISICILLLPQLYWFYLMSMGAVKVFLGTASKQEKTLSAGDSKAKAQEGKVKRS